MSKSISVTFADGTTHTYDNVPDDVTQEQVNTRARTDYPDKEIQGVAAGAAPEAPKQEAKFEPTVGEKALGAAQTGVGMANQFLSSPLGHALELGAGGGYALNKLGKMFGPGAGGGAGAPVAPTAAVPVSAPAPVSAPVAPSNIPLTPQQVAQNPMLQEMAARQATNPTVEAGGQRLIDMVKGYSNPNSLGRLAMNSAVLPAALSLPYLGAAYEQSNIRANPTAPEYATNPYAQFVRGEYATQGRAGEANRRQAVLNQQYGGLTREQQDMLARDRKEAIENLAAQKAIGR